jgi:hypothetical protein
MPGFVEPNPSPPSGGKWKAASQGLKLLARQQSLEPVGRLFGVAPSVVHPERPADLRRRPALRRRLRQFVEYARFRQRELSRQQATQEPDLVGVESGATPSLEEGSPVGQNGLAGLPGNR